MVQSEGNMSLKNPVTPPGIDPVTVRLVAQRLNHYATPGPRTWKHWEKKQETSVKTAGLLTDIRIRVILNMKQESGGNVTFSGNWYNT